MEPQYEAPPLQQTTWLQSPKPAVPTPRPETGTRLGPDFQAVIPPCEPSRPAGEERLLLLAAAALPGPCPEEALRVAVTEEKRAADSLPLDAVYDWDDPQGGCLPGWHGECTVRARLVLVLMLVCRLAQCASAACLLGSCVMVCGAPTRMCAVLCS